MLEHSGYLVGQLVIAMPQMQDSRFERAVIYVCAHNEEGAMGLVLNKPIENISFQDLLHQIGITTGQMKEHANIQFGGPVEAGRGFVLHTDDYQRDGTLNVNKGISLTATVDILKSIASGKGPEEYILALGYAGWGPGQLENEIQTNGWLIAPAEKNIVFHQDLDHKWEKALKTLGIDSLMLSADTGYA